MELTNTQLSMLSTASQRADRAIERPPNFKGGAAQKVLSRLLEQGLIEELRARGALPVWRRDEKNRSFALRITKTGLAAIKVEGAAKARLGDTKPAGDKRAEARIRSAESRQRNGAARARGRGVASEIQPEPAGRADSKQAQVIALLRCSEGATLAFMMKVTGWQPHSVRGFLAGCVRKKLKLTLTSEKVEGVRTYRIDDAGGSAAGSKRRRAA